MPVRPGLLIWQRAVNWHHPSSPVRPELVEGPVSLLSNAEEGQPLDKLRANGSGSLFSPRPIAELAQEALMVRGVHSYGDMNFDAFSCRISDFRQDFAMGM